MTPRRSFTINSILLRNFYIPRSEKLTRRKSLRYEILNAPYDYVMMVKFHTGQWKNGLLFSRKNKRKYGYRTFQAIVQFS